jgi:hypothetical protein
MAFPIRATIADVEAVCGYLLSKPTGATQAEAKAVLDSSILDQRKIGALKFWGLIVVDDDTGKMRLSERGRAVARDKGARKAKPLREAIAETEGYRAVVERAVHRNELTIAAAEVAAHWHQHFRASASESDETINQQAICFFQLAEGADLGRLIVGRKGQPTRFEFHEGNARAFVEGSTDVASESTGPMEVSAGLPAHDLVRRADLGNRVFITHTKNKRILEQIKRTVTSVGFEPVISAQSETAGKPVPEGIMGDMRSCSAAVIHIGAEGDGKGNRQLNPNVLIEIGAAMMHCPDRFVLVVEEGIEVPSNLQGLYQSRYSGDSLDWDAGMKIQEALRGLRGAKA